MQPFTTNLVVGKSYLLKENDTAKVLNLKETIVEARVEKLSTLDKRVLITLLYNSIKPESIWAEVADVKSILIDNVDETPQA